MDILADCELNNYKIKGGWHLHCYHLPGLLQVNEVKQVLPNHTWACCHSEIVDSVAGRKPAETEEVFSNSFFRANSLEAVEIQIVIKK